MYTGRRLFQYLCTLYAGLLPVWCEELGRLLMLRHDPGKSRPLSNHTTTTVNTPAAAAASSMTAGVAAAATGWITVRDCVFTFFTQPPSGRRRMRICFADVFFCFFSVRQKYETTVLGNGWTDFHETFTKRCRGKCSLKRCTAARRMANVDDLHNLRYDSFAIIRGRHARRLRYTTMSRRMDVI